MPTHTRISYADSNDEIAEKERSEIPKHHTLRSGIGRMDGRMDGRHRGDKRALPGRITVSRFSVALDEMNQRVTGICGRTVATPPWPGDDGTVSLVTVISHRECGVTLTASYGRSTTALTTSRAGFWRTDSFREAR